MDWFKNMSGSGTNRLVQSTLEGGSESALTSALSNANEKAKGMKAKNPDKKKK